MKIKLPPCPQVHSVALSDIKGGTLVRTIGGGINNQDNIFLVAKEAAFGHHLIRIVDGCAMRYSLAEAASTKFMILDAEVVVHKDL